MNASLGNSNRTPPKKEGFLCVGVIIGAHGIQGEVIIKPFTDEAEDILSLPDFETKKGRTLEFSHLRITPKGILARLDGVKNRTKAETLKGTYIYTSKEHMENLGENSAYAEELTGLYVLKEDMSEIGVVTDVFSNGAHLVLKVKVADKKAPLLLPFTEDLILEVNLEEGALTVSEMVEEFMAL